MEIEALLRPEHGRLERWVSLGSYLLDQGRPKETLELATKVLDWQPQDLGALRLREDALEALGQWPELTRKP